MEDGVNQVKESVSSSRITITVGKVGMADFFDQNAISHDPRGDFMNWALMNNGPYDYAANTRGYTGALVMEYYRPGWVFRAGTGLLPEYANGPTLNFNYLKSNRKRLKWKEIIPFKGIRVQHEFFFTTIRPAPQLTGMC